MPLIDARVHTLAPEGLAATYMTGEVIRIRLRPIISWGLGPDGQQSSRRDTGSGGPR